MRFNLRQIEVFRAVMVSGSIVGASKLLHVSQPAVSRLIAHTEQRLKLALFERIKGRLYPTPEARRLFEEISTLHQQVQRVNDLAQSLALNKEGQLRVSCSPNISQSLMALALARFTQLCPDVRIALYTDVPHVMLQALLTQQVEIGVTYMPNAHPSLSSQRLYQNRIVAVLPQEHPLADRERIHISDLQNERFIGYGNEIPFSQLVHRICHSAKVQLLAHVEVQHAHVACAMVQAGVGVALVDELTIRSPSWANVKAIPLVPAVHAPIHVFHLTHEPVSRLAQQFTQVLQAFESLPWTQSP